MYNNPKRTALITEEASSHFWTVWKMVDGIGDTHSAEMWETELVTTVTYTLMLNRV